METNIYKGQRVLFKAIGGWQAGTLDSTVLNADGLYFNIINLNNETVQVRIENIFFNARILEDWEEDYLYNVEDFFQKIADGDITSQTHSAWMSDGEYAYYSVAKWSRNWINKQPFKYILCI